MIRKCRTVWISDTHLGFRGCRADELSIFLKHIRCEKLYLVGDIVDMSRLRQRWYWPARHNDVVRRILTHARHGTEVIFVPGNHDDAARQYLNLQFGGVQVVPHCEHTTADGRRLFITHGDQYDLVVTHSRALALAGGIAYDWLLLMNRVYNGVRQRFGRPYLSLSQAIKQRVKRACTFVSRFEEALIREAKRRHVDGIVCGHIHKAEIRETSAGIGYYNCGDWVESCTALVEHFDGRIEILDGLAFVDEIREAQAEDDAFHGRGRERDDEMLPLPSLVFERETFLMPDQIALNLRAGDHVDDPFVGV